MPRITPFLSFRDCAEEAAAFYTSLFENSRIVDVTRYGASGPGPPGSVMTVAFELEGRPYVALNGGPHFRPSDAFSLAVDCATQEEIDRFWEALSEGGARLPGGWLRDRFGLYWQVAPRRLAEMLCDPDPERSKRVMDAMLKMKRVVLDELEEAYRGSEAGDGPGAGGGPTGS